MTPLEIYQWPLKSWTNLGIYIAANILIVIIFIIVKHFKER